ncbi:hypothetical protein CERSUDRAFT_114343 [Gelatoporia subvermispora B]|uniref:Uncharacterized protein n=1 Tax=Ceriporiopsis subvermispora (strain B) TaxID=914234 RepID=M2QL03_CERS8|nr:hypothetical protein CERSUDRAFT_114343 [Gelatoporia subvermispora B]
MGLPLIDAHILALFCTDIFLGIHLVTFAFALWSQIWNHPVRGRKTNWLLVAVTIVMGVIGGLNAILDVYANILAWSSNDIGIFTESAALVSIIVKVDEAIPPLIGDAILIYRCWLVYQRKWTAVIISMIIWLLCLALSIFVVIKSALAKFPGGINSPELRPYTGAALVLTVVLNVITTSLIVFRIWSGSKQLRTSLEGRSRLTYVIRVIVESGLLYMVTAVIVLCTAVTGSSADYITGESFVQITGISFNLMIIRFDQNLADSQTEMRMTTRSDPCSNIRSEDARQSLAGYPPPPTLTVVIDDDGSILNSMEGAVPLVTIHPKKESV